MQKIQTGQPDVRAGINYDVRVADAQGLVLVREEDVAKTFEIAGTLTQFQGEFGLLEPNNRMFKTRSAAAKEWEQETTD